MLTGPNEIFESKKYKRDVVLYESIMLKLSRKLEANEIQRGIKYINIDRPTENIK